jgi:putative DNA primase/helicase
MTGSVSPPPTADELVAIVQRLRAAVPEALRERKQWLLWRFEPGDKKPKKMPYYVGGSAAQWGAGHGARSRPTHRFDEALAAFALGGWSGLGFAFLPGDGLIGIDIDGQIAPDTGEISARASNIIASCDSYTEYSPSRRGVHIIVAGNSDTFKSNDIGLEVFCGRQFFTVTGERYAGTPAEVRAIDERTLNRLHKTVDQAKRTTPATTRAQRLPPPMRAPRLNRRCSRSRRTSATTSGSRSAWPSTPSSATLGSRCGITGQARARSTPRRASSKRTGNRSAARAASPARHCSSSPAQRAGNRRAVRKALYPTNRYRRTRNLQPRRATIVAPLGPIFTGRRHCGATVMACIKNTPANVDLVLRHEERWEGVLAYDEFSYRIVKRRAPPFAGGRPGPWEETDAIKTAIWLERVWAISAKSHVVDEIARSIAWDARFHSVREWLDSLDGKWDGTERLPTLMQDAFGAEQTEYTEHIGIGLLVTAVARVYRPGCKVDTMVVLEGGQGMGKSTALIELFSPAWYVDIIDPPSHKDFYITLQGGWCVEIGEMQSFTRSEVNQVKQAITRRDDKFRAPYDKAASEHPRQSIFVGTTNADSYLMDPTGGRRFLAGALHACECAVRQRHA